MRKLFIHVGPHKTGTTAIQKFMLDNHAVLFANGLVYPKRYLQIFGHHKFREKIVNKNVSAQDMEFFGLQTHNYLLSSEDFISLSKQDFEYIKQQFSDFEVHVIFSWRRASNKMYSIWQEVIKHGDWVDFFAYYHNHIAKPGSSQMLSPDLKISTLAQVFGRKNIHIIDYEASQKNNALFSDYLKTLGLSFDDKYNIKIDENAKNESMPVQDIEIIRALNLIFNQQYQIKGAAVRNAFKQHFDGLSKDLIAQLHKIISDNLLALNVGNYFIDVRAEKIMNERFSANLVNYQPYTDNKTVQIASSEWLLNQHAQTALNELAKQLYQLAFAQQ